MYSMSGLLEVARKSFGAPELVEEDDESLQSRTKEPDEHAREAALECVRSILGKDRSQLPDDFLRKCLVYQKWDARLAAKIATGFQRFRATAQWPMRISSAEVELALRSGLHWLLWPAQEAVTPSDSHWCNGSTCTDGGPAACLVFNMASLDVTVCQVEEYQKMSMFLMERATDCVEVQKRGIALIADFRGMQVTRLLRTVGVEDMQRGLRCWLGSFPCRMRRIWLIGTPGPLRLMVNMALQLLSTKVRQRVRMADGQSGLAKVVEDLSPCVQLPESLGGSSSFDWQVMLNRYLDCKPGAEKRKLLSL
eukprot:TRINITY_DN15860_c0_g1_i1.p1 TRINITY_DN15860_c0_g1~~TRINITY_DN15860_c0_g1_i1.p1  ORF type:complete len:308 (+),score=55.80 TRINITY_DN15860_c0_g1_i1:32-955(+)